MPTSKVTVDSVVERGGWLALTYNMRAWSLPCRAGSKPKLLNAGRHPAPHQDPSFLWLNTDGFAIAVDSAGTPTGERVPLPDDSWLRSSVDGTHVFWNPHRGTSLLARPGEPAVELPHMSLEHACGTTALLSEVGGRRLYRLNMHTGKTEEVRAGGEHAWDNLSSVQSPDGTMIAITVELEPPPERPVGMSLNEWLDHLRELPPRALGRLVGILDLRTGGSRIGSTTLPTAFAPHLAWSADGGHVALKTHDTKTSTTGAAYGWMDARSLDLTLSPTTCRSASPYVDISSWYSG